MERSTTERDGGAAAASGRRVAATAFALLVSLLAPYAGAQISAIPAGEFQGDGLIDFESIDADQNGTNINGVLDLDGASFAERFAGQTLGQETIGTSVVDTVAGAPSGPLTLQPGLNGQNLAVLRVGGNRLLVGLGAVGFPNARAIGEGAVSILFDQDQAEFSVTVSDGNGGDLLMEFFRRDGTRIVALLGEDLELGTRFNLLRDGEINDIAGVTLTVFDLDGVGFDNVRFGRRGGGSGGTLFENGFE